MDNHQKYIGKELALFAEARNWKSYLGRLLEPSIRGHVLEVGAGIGSITQFLSKFHHSKWTCLEPDDHLADQIRQANRNLLANGQLSVVNGTIDDLDAGCKFDTILYVDVLEHIPDDLRELSKAASHLNASGLLLVLSPAHQFLYSPFDEKIGHYRRYDKTTLVSISPKHCSVLDSFYLDSAGLLASLSNRLLLKQTTPSRRQIHIWDRFLVPVSEIMDALFRYKFGKSVIVIWRREP
jgi:SAM-dependent methyltransferase